MRYLLGGLKWGRKCGLLLVRSSLFVFLIGIAWRLFCERLTCSFIIFSFFSLSSYFSFSVLPFIVSYFFRKQYGGREKARGDY